jgi:DNA (cytosine-5)-methyltransferase 1
MTRDPIIRVYLGDNNVIADNFAGGGGVSEAFRRAIGRAPHHAINHDDEALAMHAANHPETKHHHASVWDVDPSEICAGKRISAAWFSPDCKDHSSAKGGKPVDRKIRALAWVAVRWAKRVAPEVIFLENVPEFRDWGPCIEIDGELRRDPARKGQTFRKFVRRLEAHGYSVEWRIMKACDYGAPTSRKRLLMVARRDGLPIVWPEPTHGPALIGLKPYRTAAECIDWSIPCPSIFMNADEAKAYTKKTGIKIKRPLVDNTLARIAAGCDRFVFKTAQPFVVSLRGTEPSHIRSSSRGLEEPLRTISADGWHHGVVMPYLVPAAHGPKAGHDRRAHDINAPVPTITAERRSSFALVAPFLVQNGQGERVGQRPRWMDIEKPLGTVVACGQRHAIVQVAFVANGNSMRDSGGFNIGHPIDVPMSTVTAQRQKSLVSVQFDTEYDPQRAAAVAAFLMRYNGTSIGQSLHDPLSTIDTKDRFALVTVTFDGWPPLTLADIGYRLLEPRELFRAQGVDDSYVIDPLGPDGDPLSRTAQIRMCGNMVPPDLAAAVIAANPARSWLPTQMARAA